MGWVVEDMHAWMVARSFQEAFKGDAVVQVLAWMNLVGEVYAVIVGNIQKNFQFDHIGIGILDYATKEIEIRSEAGTTAHEKGKKVPLGTGILGRVARSGEASLVNASEAGQLQGVLPDSRTVLCIPIAYGDTLLGVLNVESKQENAISPEDVGRE